MKWQQWRYYHLRETNQIIPRDFYKSRLNECLILMQGGAQIGVWLEIVSEGFEEE